MTRRACAALWMILSVPVVLSARQSASPAWLLPGEELVYNVSYASFDIGQVRISVLADTLLDGVPVHRAAAHIDSYKGIPFVNLHTVYRSLTSPQGASLEFMSRTKQDGKWRQFVYRFDYPAHVVRIEHRPAADEPVDKRDSIRVDTAFQDGLSLFFYARSKLHSGERVSIPTIVSEAVGNTTIKYETDIGSEEIDAVKYPVDVLHFDGNAGFVGIYGLTGDFEGWFSNDAASVPILAKMKVLIGSVRIELIRWTRPGWTPPRAAKGSGR